MIVDFSQGCRDVCFHSFDAGREKRRLLHAAGKLAAPVAIGGGREAHPQLPATHGHPAKAQSDPPCGGLGVRAGRSADADAAT